MKSLDGPVSTQALKIKHQRCVGSTFFGVIIYYSLTDNEKLNAPSNIAFLVGSSIVILTKRVSGVPFTTEFVPTTSATLVDHMLASSAVAYWTFKFSFVANVVLAITLKSQLCQGKKWWIIYLELIQQFSVMYIKHSWKYLLLQGEGIFPCPFMKHKCFWDTVLKNVFQELSLVNRVLRL